MPRYFVFFLTVNSLFAQVNTNLTVTPAAINSPMQQMMEAQRIRNLQMQERIQAEELRRLQIENQGRSSTRPAPQQRPDVKPVDAGTETRGLYNGRLWKQLSAMEKILFVVGFTNGIGITSPPNAGAYVPVNLTNREISDGLDRFYLEPENLLVPMCMSVTILAAKSSGSESSIVASMIAEVRRWSIQ